VAAYRRHVRVRGTRPLWCDRHGPHLRPFALASRLQQWGAYEHPESRRDPGCATNLAAGRARGRTRQPAPPPNRHAPPWPRPSTCWPAIWRPSATHASPGASLPARALARRIRKIERRLGMPLPPALKVFWGIVGGVSFVDLTDYAHVRFWQEQGLAGPWSIATGCTWTGAMTTGSIA
jgi:hypothetical protein